MTQLFATEIIAANITLTTEIAGRSLLTVLMRPARSTTDCLASCGGTTWAYFSLCGAKCNCLLAYKSRACLFGGCIVWHNVHDGHVMGTGRCLEASNSVNVAFNAICVLTGVSGIGISAADGLRQLVDRAKDEIGRVIPSIQEWRDYLLK